jgi:hypothetical protein
MNEEEERERVCVSELIVSTMKRFNKIGPNTMFKFNINIFAILRTC